MVQYQSASPKLKMIFSFPNVRAYINMVQLLVQ